MTIAELLSCSTDRLYGMVKENIPYFRLGMMIRFDPKLQMNG
jgi:hypothetical protein